jgi:hypothetical protein
MLQVYDITFYGFLLGQVLHKWGNSCTRPNHFEMPEILPVSTKCLSRCRMSLIRNSILKLEITKCALTFEVIVTFLVTIEINVL